MSQNLVTWKDKMCNSSSSLSKLLLSKNKKDSNLNGSFFAEVFSLSYALYSYCLKVQYEDLQLKMKES